MALTKITRGLLNTGIEDNSDETVITIDSAAQHMHRVGFGTSNPIDILHTKTTNPTADYNTGCGINLVHNSDSAQRYSGIWFDADGGDFSATSVGGFTKYYASITKKGNGGTLNVINYDNSDIEFYVGGFQFNKKKVIIADNSDLKFNSGFGSVATAYGVRAWANINQSTDAIRDSGNVSTVSDEGTALYKINFSNAMPDTNYALLGTANNDNNMVGIYGSPPTTYSTTQVEVRISDASNIVQELTNGILNIAVIR